MVREACRPELFAEMREKGVAVLTYHKYPGEDWPAATKTITYPWTSRATHLRSRSGDKVGNAAAPVVKTAIPSTNYVADFTMLAVSMFARWSQENFFKYMREHYGLDRLVEYGTEPVPAAVRVVNPAWRKLDSHRQQRKNGRLAVTSIPGRGSTFTLYVPCAEIKAGNDRSAHPT